MRTPRYSIEQTDFAVPLVPGLHKISLNNVDTGRPLAQDCLALLVDSPTGRYTNTGMQSFSLWLSFLAIV